MHQLRVREQNIGRAQDLPGRAQGAQVQTGPAGHVRRTRPARDRQQGHAGAPAVRPGCAAHELRAARRLRHGRARSRCRPSATGHRVLSETLHWSYTVRVHLHTG